MYHAVPPLRQEVGTDFLPKPIGLSIENYGIVVILQEITVGPHRFSASAVVADACRITFFPWQHSTSRTQATNKHSYCSCPSAGPAHCATESADMAVAAVICLVSKSVCCKSVNLCSALSALPASWSHSVPPSGGRCVLLTLGSVSTCTQKHGHKRCRPMGNTHSACKLYL